MNVRSVRKVILTDSIFLDTKNIVILKLQCSFHSVCCKVYSRKDSLTHHKCKGETVKEKVCYLCNADFGSTWRLTRHMSQAHSDKNLNCKKCGKIYQSRPAYEEHMEKCRGVRVKDNQKESFTCSTCGKTYYRLYAFECHQDVCMDQDIDIGIYEDLDEEVIILDLQGFPEYSTSPKKVQVSKS